MFQYPNRGWKIYIMTRDSCRFLIIIKCVSGFRFIEKTACLCWGHGSLRKLLTHQTFFIIPQKSLPQQLQMEQWYICHCEEHNAVHKKSLRINDRLLPNLNSWHMAGFICLLKDPFNAALESDEIQILITKRGDWRLCRIPLWTQMSSKEKEGQVSEKEIMTLVPN